jgi:hypothetical protein
LSAFIKNFTFSGRRHNPDQTGTLILRGISDPKDRQIILNHLNQENIRKTWSDESDCVQILAWDDDLAEAAQAWADQCAMVEYRKEKSLNFSKITLNQIFYSL